MREKFNVLIEQTLPVDKETYASIKLPLKDKSNVARVRVNKRVKEVVKVKKVTVKETPVVPVRKSIEAKSNNALRKTDSAQKRKSEAVPAHTEIKNRKYTQIEECEIQCDLNLVIGDQKASRCKCVNSKNNCGQASCLNRAMYFECSSKCTNGANCKNRRFQNVNKYRFSTNFTLF